MTDLGQPTGDRPDAAWFEMVADNATWRLSSSTAGCVPAWWAACRTEPSQRTNLLGVRGLRGGGSAPFPDSDLQRRGV